MPETNEAAVEAPIILEYQHTDATGAPLLDGSGRPIVTNFTGKSKDEIIEKLKDAHINSTRALNRVQRYKPTPKPAEPSVHRLSEEEQRQATADLLDPTKAESAARKLAGTDQIDAALKEAEKKQNNADALAAQLKFMSAHLTDYYPCQANSKVIWDYINEKELDPRVVDNFEIAFNAVQAQLAQRPAPAAPPAPITPEPEPPAQRRQAAGGIQPGSLSGARPIQRKKELVTKDDIKRMRATEEGRSEYKRRLKDPAFVSAVDALFARP